VAVPGDDSGHTHRTCPILTKVPVPPDNDALRADATEWLARRSNGGQNAQDQRAFLAWLNASESHRRAYAEAEDLWEALRGLDRVAERQLVQARGYVQRRRRPSAGRRAAIAAVVLLAAGGLWWADQQSHLDDSRHVTAVGQRQAIDLPDGSRLELNTDSQALVHYSRHVREVRLLRGQAVFTVAMDHDRPFDVIVGQGRVRDISTQFEVRRWADRTRVAVLDGAVEVSPGPNRPPARLTRGLSVDFSDKGDLSAPRAIDINTHAAWRDGQIVFQNQTLREVLEELARYHGGSIAVGSPGLMDVRISGAVPTDDVALALRTVAAALPARLHQAGPQSWRLDPR
jgi:transmembrane sensor